MSQDCNADVNTKKGSQKQSAAEVTWKIKCVYLELWIETSEIMPQLLFDTGERSWRKINTRVWHKEMDRNNQKDYIGMISNIVCWKLKERERL